MRRPFSGDGAAWLDLVTGAANLPHGFEDITASTITWDRATRKLTITPPAGGDVYWSSGDRYRFTVAKSKVIADASGLHYVYLDGETLTETDTWADSLVTAKVLVAVVSWDSAGAVEITVCDMRQHAGAPPEWVLDSHETVGAAWTSGLEIQDLTFGDGSNNAHATCSIESGSIRIASHPIDIADGAPQSLASPAQIPVYYRAGAGGVLKRKDADNYPFMHDPASRVLWNKNTAGTWSQVEAGALEYVCAPVYASTDIAEPIFAMQGMSSYSSLPAAEIGAIAEHAMHTLLGLPTGHAQAKLIGVLLIQTDMGYANTPHARFVESGDGAQYGDARYTRMSSVVPLDFVVPPRVSAAEITAGTETDLRSWSPADAKAAVYALGPLLDELPEMVGIPNDTERRYWRAPVNCTITHVYAENHVAATSALGTYKYEVLHGATSLLAAQYDLESLVADTRTDVALTATTADLDLAKGDLIYFDAISDHIDLVSADTLRFSVEYVRR